MMKHVFISYARADLAIKKQVQQRLVKAGLSVWSDEKLKPEDPSYTKDIEQALDNARCVVVLLSPDAKKSSWIDIEINYAKDAVQIPVVVVVVRGEPHRVKPLRVFSSQHIDLREELESGLQNLSDTLKRIYDEALPETGSIPPDPPLSFLRLTSTQTSLYRISEITEKRSSSTAAQNAFVIRTVGSGLLSSTSEIVYRAKEGFPLQTNEVAFTVDETVVDTDFLVYSLRLINPRRFVVGFATPRLDINELMKLTIALPSLEEQRQLGEQLTEGAALMDAYRKALQREMEALQRVQIAILQTTFA